MSCPRPAGDGLVVSASGPGIFLQGLAVHGPAGAPLPGAVLDRGVVAAAFEYAERMDVPLCAFLGDTCATLRMEPELKVAFMAHRAGVPILDANMLVLRDTALMRLLILSCQRWTAPSAGPVSHNAVLATCSPGSQVCPAACTGAAY